MEVDLKTQLTIINTNRVGWGLFQSLVLLHLNDLEDLSHKVMTRIDQEIYRCVSELVALRRMLNHFDLHRPTLGLANPSIMQQRRRNP